MAPVFDAFSNQFDALAIRLPALGDDAGALAHTRPVAIFAQQDMLNTGLFDRPTHPAGPNQLEVLGDQRLGELDLPRDLHQQGRLPENVELNRVIFVLDCSTSMAELLVGSGEQTKLDHVIARIGQLAEDFLPPGTKISLVTFNDRGNAVNLGEVRNGALMELKQKTASLSPGGGTNFLHPLNLCLGILREDSSRHVSHDPENGPPRSLVFFLTDGQDQTTCGLHQTPNQLMEALRDLNTTTFVVGIGEDYSMSRIVDLAGSAGASSWSHIPLEQKMLDVFDVQIPEMLQQLLSCENYFRISASGSFSSLAAVAPTIRFAPSAGRMIYPGFVRDAAGVLYEREEDLQLTLHAGRSVADPDGYQREIEIVDIADAVGKYEQGQRAEDLSQRLLMLRALLDRDPDLLRAVAQINPTLAPQVDQFIDQMRQSPHSHGGGSQDLYTSMSITGYTSQSFPSQIPTSAQGASLDTKSNVSRTMHFPSAPQVPEDPGAGEAALHSGYIGRLDNGESIGFLPPVQNPNPDAYRDLKPRNLDCASLQMIGLQSKRYTLEKLETGEIYILGRSQYQPDGIAIAFGIPNISRRHCRIFLNEGRCLLEDLGSTNGTLVNGKALAPGQPIALNNGDRIKIADGLKFIFNLPDNQGKH